MTTLKPNWSQYLGDMMTPEEYGETYGDVYKQLVTDLTARFASHETDSMTTDEIATIARALTVVVEETILDGCAACFLFEECGFDAEG